MDDGGFTGFVGGFLHEADSMAGCITFPTMCGSKYNPAMWSSALYDKATGANPHQGMYHSGGYTAIAVSLLIPAGAEGDALRGAGQVAQRVTASGIRSGTRSLLRGSNKFEDALRSDAVARASKGFADAAPNLNLGSVLGPVGSALGTVARLMEAFPSVADSLRYMSYLLRRDR
jgi:hypothetical protein